MLRPTLPLSQIAKILTRLRSARVDHVIVRIELVENPCRRGSLENPDRPRLGSPELLRIDRGRLPDLRDDHIDRLLGNLLRLQSLRIGVGSAMFAGRKGEKCQDQDRRERHHGEHGHQSNALLVLG